MDSVATLHRPATTTTPPSPIAGERAKGEGLEICRVPLAVGIASALTILINLWVRHAELVTGNYVVGGVPPVPTVTFLLFIVPLAFAARRFGIAFLSRSEILLIYAFLTVSVFMTTFGVARAFFPSLTVPFYFATPENRFADYWSFIPDWFGPRNLELIRRGYEGSTAGVPWFAWLPHLGIWLGFFIILFLTLMCLMVLFRKPWVENERLSFPLLYLPIELTAGLDQKQDSAGDFVRNLFASPLMWVGFAVVTLYHCMNIFHTLQQSVPLVPPFMELGPLFTERPWNAVQPLRFSFLFATIGFGYLVPMEILFSLWFFYLLEKGVAVLGRVTGYEPAGFPFQQEQSIGAYVALAVILIWMARQHLKVLVGWFVCPLVRSSHWSSHAATVPTNEPTNQPTNQLTNQPTNDEVWALRGVVIGFAAIIGYAWLAGMSLGLALLFFGLIFAVALTTARVRAEAGLAIMWPFPADQQKELIINTFGTPRLSQWFGMRSLTLLSTFSFLSRYHFPLVTQYQADNLRLAEEARVPRRTMIGVMTFALVLGLICAFIVHLSAYYEFGENVLEGSATLTGGDRTRVALAGYTRIFQTDRAPQLPVAERAGASAIGFMITAALAWLRFGLLKFPLSPLGYAVANAYGAMSPYWGPFLVVWFAKGIILKIGGASLYRRYIPFFLGIVVGQYFMGLVWATVSVFLDPEINRRYGISLSA